ncbi:MAG TPA: hypothetical protein VN970_02445, partial [Thermoanaerobaculia bacterium]|nr:hypothetical protein [Thermoanaerobaculia bacterium]
MGRTVAVVWHALISVVAGIVYFFFVLPRWWELSGQTSHTLGTVMRIVAGALIALAALPVVLTLLRTRRPEYGTPQLALRLRVCSIVLHVLGGVLIIGAAVSEIWLSLDAAGPWLFGIYGAAAAICLLGIFSFYLAFVAELPPPPPRPLKKKKERKRRWRRKGADEAGDEDQAEDQAEDEDADEDEAADEDEDEASKTDEAGETVTAETTDETQATEDTATETTEAVKAVEAVREDVSDETQATKETEDTVADQPAHAGLRNRRPSGKIRRPRLRRKSGGVTVE